MGLLGWLGWTLVDVGMLVLIFVSMKTRNAQPLATRRSAIFAGLAALGGMISLVGAAVDQDTGGIIRYALFLALLAILVVAVSRRRGDA
jgi:FtsH-binding integral membrane protein